MKIKRFFPMVLCALMLVFAVSAASVFGKSQKGDKAEPEQKTETIAKAREQQEEMRGLWVTYMELDMENEADKSEAGFRKKFENIASTAEKQKFNTIIAQVRPFCDALYKSKYFPYSHIMSGTQGVSPGYDALKIMCEICKKHKLKIHAWINPYRIALNESPPKLAEHNPYYNDEPLCIEADNWIILDPSCEDARELIINGIIEITENYDVDGIQFDDYFYPADIGNLDDEQYQNYLENTKSKSQLSLEEWRKNNVNMLIAEAYMTIHAKNKNIEFGISPQGNLKNNEKLAADVVSWCGARGYIDYICPQIYFSPNNPKLGFEESLDEWTSLEFAEGVKLYVGLAGYKANTESDEGTWLEADDILSKEYRLAKADKKVSGVMLYSYASLVDKDKIKEINNLVESFS